MADHRRDRDCRRQSFEAPEPNARAGLSPSPAKWERGGGEGRRMPEPRSGPAAKRAVDQILVLGLGSTDVKSLAGVIGAS